MENAPSLRTGTVIIHPDHGKGVVICHFDDPELGDCIEVMWQSLNIIMEHRTESLKKQLTVSQFPARSISPWAALAAEEQ